MTVQVHVAALNRFLRPPGGTVSPLGARLFGTGVNIQTRAKRLVPVDTGRLRASILTTAPFQRRGRLVVTVGSVVHYAGYVEKGTRFMRARPYLVPALEQEMQQ